MLSLDFCFSLHNYYAYTYTFSQLKVTHVHVVMLHNSSPVGVQEVHARHPQWVAERRKAVPRVVAGHQV